MTLCSPPMPDFDQLAMSWIRDGAAEPRRANGVWRKAVDLFVAHRALLALVISGEQVADDRAPRRR